MPDFSTRVADFWRADHAGFRMIVDAELPWDRRVSLLRRHEGGIAAKVDPSVAALIGTPQSEARFRAVLAAAGIALHEPDNIYYFSESAHSELSSSGSTRRLSPADADLFARFERSATEPDRDDAFVELDHWAVFGSFDGDRLVAAASAYPWGDSALADIGVLTLPEFRGRGHARRAVRALAAHIVAEGFEPQYRCQLDNAGSIAVAASAGLTLFGTWEVVSPDSVV